MLPGETQDDKWNPRDRVETPDMTPVESQIPHRSVRNPPRRYFPPAFRNKMLLKTKSEILECAARYQMHPATLWDRVRKWKSRYLKPIHGKRAGRDEPPGLGEVDGNPWCVDLLQMVSPTYGPPSALSIVFDAGPPGCLSLGLLVAVQDARVGQQDALADRLSVLPLPALQGCLSELIKGREFWDKCVLRPAADAVTRTQGLLWAQQLNLLCFYIALWQRRHPLGVVALVLEKYRSGELDAYISAPGRSSGSPVELLEGVLEALTDALYPWLAAIPNLIRCDVFMTYPHMPLNEQQALMQEVTSRCYEKEWKARGSSEPAGSMSKGGDPSGADGMPSDVWGSKGRINAKELLHDYISEESIPDLHISTELTDAGYRALRLALEKHKIDGVRRLTTESYAVYKG
ncbi:unnamed protein product [Phytomonas sp. EM1]|nr:unnamed protein product [Phytomonas sp. EM1]|eukprot:CCW63562.1 unnamed protein product [Phytomonas sp. isolate EM1]